jgi:hypothetical protein
LHTPEVAIRRTVEAPIWASVVKGEMVISFSSIQKIACFELLL